MSGGITRREFVRRATILGLSVSSIGAVLAACSQAAAPSAAAPSAAAPSAAAPSAAAPSAAAPSAAPSAAGAASLDDIIKIIYPEGADTIKDFQGPFGKAPAAVMPWEYHDVLPSGAYSWKCNNFKADKEYRFAFANFSQTWEKVLVAQQRVDAAAALMGVKVDYFDNNFDADQAIKNADLIVQGKYDYCVELQVFPDTNKAIYEKLLAAGIQSSYFGVPATDEPEATFYDVGGVPMYQALGAWVGQYAKDNWGGKVDLVVLAAQPRAGLYVAQREVNYTLGIKSVLPDLPDSVFANIDTQGLLDEAQKKTADLLTTKPDAKYILGCGTNDDAGVGIVRALQAANRAEFSAVAGQAGTAAGLEELAKPDSPFKVSGLFDTGALSWCVAIGVLQLMGGTPAINNLAPYFLATNANLKDFPPQT